MKQLMDRNFTFHTSLNKSGKPLTDDKTWDKVIDAHKRKDYKSVVRGIVDYVDLDLAEKTANPDRTVYDIPHGSALVHLKISENNFEVHTPFLNINGSKRIPLLRKVSELNFSPLNLSTIHLEGEDLVFYYKCPIELCEPYKTYDALREICIYADSYDDEFITKFDANWIHEPKIIAYSDEQKQQAWDNMQLYVNEAEAAVGHFLTKRNYNLAWDVLTISLMKMEYHLQPQGMLRIEIEKMMSYLTGSQDPINEKVNRGKKFLAKLKNYNRDEFNEMLYATETFIPYKVRSNAQTLKNNSENTFAQSKKEIERGDHLAATFTLLYHFFNIFYHNNIPNDIVDSIENGLKKASGKQFKESSVELYNVLQGIMTEQLAKPKSNGNKRKGLFGKLFGKN